MQKTAENNMISTRFITDYLNLSAPESQNNHAGLISGFNDFFDSFVAAANMAVMAVDMNRKIVITNSLAATLLETSEAKLIDQYVEDVLPKSPLTNVMAGNYKSIPRQFEMFGRTLYAERTLISREQVPIALVSFFQDITHMEKRTERHKQAQEQELFLNDIIENSYDGIYITDRRGKTIMVNKAYERISGIPRDTIIGEYMSNLVASGLLSTSLTDEVVSSKETVTRTQRNRNDKEVVITGNPVFDEKGEVRHVITNVRDITELVNLNTKLAAESSRADLYQEQILRKAADENIAYGSREFENVLNLCGKVSKMDSTVLILGETGVGKEIVAQYIHKHSPRKSKPYIKINCGAIPQNLLESELFGYVSGAFTGANAKGKPGRFELADTGTLFLDEIGELPLNLQASLLRVLQDSEITRIGDSKSKKVDVRIITATNRNLESMIRDGLFRSDLYYRLNVVSINIPPLRERKLDIPPLAEKTIQDLNRKYNTKKSLSSDFVRLLTEHNWPGNIRELKNFIEKQFVLSDSDVIDAAVSPNISVETAKNVMLSKESSESSAKLPTYDEARGAMERDLFRRAMEQGKSTYKAAALLGMSQSTFFRKYKEVFPKETR